MDVAIYLAEDATASPPAILFLHSATGHADLFQDECERFAKAGISCFSLEAPYSAWRDPNRKPGLVDPLSEIRVWNETGRELSQLVELATSKYRCDPNRLGFLGLNLGGSVGAFWLQTQENIRAAAFAGCIPSLSHFWAHSSDPRAVSLRRRTDINPGLYTQLMHEQDLRKTILKLNSLRCLVQFGLADDWIGPNERAEFMEKVSPANHIEIQVLDDDHDMKKSGTQLRRQAFFISNLKKKNPLKDIVY